jgi:hypothetical protein
MATSGSSLTNLWVDDGTGNLIPVTQSTAITGTQLPNDVLQFYEDVGVDSLARETGIIEDEEVVATTITSPPPPPPVSRTIKLIAVPISSAQKATATVKVENGATVPRTVRISAASQHMIGTSPIVFTGASGTVLHASQVVTPKVIQLVTAPPPAHSSNNMALGQSHQSWTTASVPRKRIADPYDSLMSDSKRRKGEKSGGKGLRHFSMKVCEKVQRKGVTTYNEVADELVSELSDLPGGLVDYTGSQQFDQKNIRRRVYDALNVLMAMNIISKEKKEIRWIGLPTNTAQECQGLEVEKRKRIERLQQKTQQLQELILQQIAFKNLVERNRRQELENGQPPDSGSVIRLPFIIVNTSKSTVIDCSISDDKSEYLFNFDRTFEIHDDIEVLKRMGLAFGLEKGQCTEADLARAVKMVPKSLEPYVTEMAYGKAASRVVIKTEVHSSDGASTATGDAYHLDDCDSEVAMATANSPESSYDSYSDIHSSTVQDFSDDSESNL